MTRTTQLLTQLQFHEITPAYFGEIARHMELTDSRTCDYTLGGIVLWTRHFSYRMAEANDTLFITGGREDNLAIQSFALPLGGVDFAASLKMLEDFTGHDLWFSAIPEDRLHLFATEPTATVSELGKEWSDYLYDIHSIASLQGGAMKKKRNHVNRFLSDYPQATLAPLTAANIGGCLELLRFCGHDDTPTGISEYDAVESMLRNWGDYAPYFSGGVLTLGSHIAGFTVGETKGDTLHLHVERADHTLQGANEALASMFAADMSEKYPRLAYVNRQDDAGDPGLRASKESWHPLRLLPKFNVHLQG